MQSEAQGKVMMNGENKPPCHGHSRKEELWHLTPDLLLLRVIAALTFTHIFINFSAEMTFFKSITTKCLWEVYKMWPWPQGLSISTSGSHNLNAQSKPSPR